MLEAVGMTKSMQRKIMILVAVIIPDIIYRSAMKETVVERLRLVY